MVWSLISSPLVVSLPGSGPCCKEYFTFFDFLIIFYLFQALDPDPIGDLGQEDHQGQFLPLWEIVL